MRLGLSFVMGCFCLSSLAIAAGDAGNVLIKNVTVHPITGAEIPGGSVLVIDGKIAEVGAKVSAKAGARVVDGHGLHLYPGMINAATNVGLSEISSVRDTVDLDEIGLFNPELRAEVAFNPSSEHVEVTRASGITSVISLPGTGGRGGRRGGGATLITGQGALMHLDGWTWEGMAVKPSALMDVVFPQIQTVSRQGAAAAGGPARSYADEEKQYKIELENLHQFFEQARHYQRAKAAGGAGFQKDIRFEAMIPVIDGKTPIFARAERERMIKDAIEFFSKENVKLIIADPLELGSAGALLKEKNIPVVLSKPLTLPMRDDDPYDSSYTLPSEFYKAASMSARTMFRALAAGVVALAVVALPVLADELFGTVKSVDPEGKKIVVTEKDTDKDIDVMSRPDTDYTTPAKKGGESKTQKLDLEKMKTNFEKAKEKGRPINVKVTHEKGVASKVEVQVKKKAAN